MTLAEECLEIRIRALETEIERLNEIVTMLLYRGKKHVQLYNKEGGQ